MWGLNSIETIGQALNEKRLITFSIINQGSEILPVKQCHKLIHWVVNLEKIIIEIDRLNYYFEVIIIDKKYERQE